MSSGSSLLKPARPPGPAWLHDAVFYQVYPQSFADSNGDGIGDLPGLISRLDYLRDLGVNALWLNPIYPSPFGDAGYDVSDYCAVAPRYGTLADARRLFREAHRRGMRVVLDLVAGHTSSAHPWFQASARPGRNRHSDHYIWTDSVWAAFGQTDFIKGASDRDGGYLTNFFHFQPALNYGYAPPDPQKPWQQPVNAAGPRAVVAELRRIMAFWLKLGCDGFRVDMAASLIRGPQAASAIRTFWREQRAWLGARWPQAVLVSEWGDPSAAIPAGFHIDFLLHFGKPAYRELCAPVFRKAAMKKNGRGFFDAAGRGDITKFLASYLAEFRATRRHGYIALPTGNHDFSRFMNHRGERELRVFLALLLTLPGVPFIYYGDEIGLRYRDLPNKEGGYRRTGSRTPMQWTAGRNRGFSTAAARRLYLPIDQVPGCDVESQTGRPGSTLEWVRTLLALRKMLPALGNSGGFRTVYARAAQVPFVFERSTGHERIVIAVNPTGRVAPRVALPDSAHLEPLLMEGARADRMGLHIAAFGIGVWKRK
jgi:maltose alpha-D-glucosyltransferase/alpha-amylase